MERRRNLVPAAASVSNLCLVTVGKDLRAIDETAIIRGKEERDFCDLFRFASTAERDPAGG